MTHGSLFSGIGGFDLAAERMGWENKFHCEWNEFGQRVLKFYWPHAESFHDITKTDFKPYANRIDILTGGFPCQPYSLAGKRKGKEDERHLWPEMLRAIREIRPRWVVGENVFGLINWSGGLVFHEVQADLEAEGYEVFPYVLPAAAVNAPHRRDRIWFVAYRNGSRSQGSGIDGEGEEYFGVERHGQQRTTSNTAGEQGQRMQFEQREHSEPKQGEHRGDSSPMGNTRFSTDAFSRRGRENEWRSNREPNEHDQACTPGAWDNFPTQSPVCFGDDGLSSELDGITFSKWTNESIKAAGNAICHQVALQIFDAIQQYENLKP